MFDPERNNALLASIDPAVRARIEASARKSDLSFEQQVRLLTPVILRHLDLIAAAQEQAESEAA